MQHYSGIYAGISHQKLASVLLYVIQLLFQCYVFYLYELKLYCCTPVRVRIYSSLIKINRQCINKVFFISLHDLTLFVQFVNSVYNVYCVMCSVWLLLLQTKNMTKFYNYDHASGNFFFVKHDKNSTFFTFPTSVQHEN